MKDLLNSLLRLETGRLNSLAGSNIDLNDALNLVVRAYRLGVLHTLKELQQGQDEEKAEAKEPAND